jgi:hypothetical protein
MPEEREHSVRVQAEAVAVIATRVAHDPGFADEFIGVVERGDKETLEAFARSAGVVMDEVVIIPVPGGVCVCKGRVCICIIYRDENA